MNKRDSEWEKGGAINSQIGEQTKFVGNVSGSEDILINGEMDGDISVSASVHIGPTGSFKGMIKAKNVIIEGKVEGAIKVEDKIELLNKAAITADMECKHLAVADGAFYEGKVHMEGMEGITPLHSR
jgi:cytoskeletal protein CcmA (bactofilin family)